jgi:predicted aconitase
MSLSLTADEQAMLDGARGTGVAMAMRLVVGVTNAMKAESLVPIVHAHIDSCLFHGQSGLDFAQRLVDGGAQTCVPTTLNVSSLDLIHPELFVGDDATAVASKQLMDAYVALGCEPTWTCAPYQRATRPAVGDQIAWAESNAIVFANSVLGARTHRYGDFIDIAAAITGRVPYAGLHRSEDRVATRLFDASGVERSLLEHDVAYACLGLVIGRQTGNHVPAIAGLHADTSEDQLKALGAAAASSGSVALFHAVGLTPEAATLNQATGGADLQPIQISTDQLEAVRAELSRHGTGKPLAVVSVGTPHYSIDEIGRLHSGFDGRHVDTSVHFYVSTSREILNEAKLRGWAADLETAGVQFVTDTCTYITPIITNLQGAAMTDSAKWAYYAPGNIGAEAVLATQQECIESAVAGRQVHLASIWSGVSP